VINITRLRLYIEALNSIESTKEILNFGYSLTDIEKVQLMEYLESCFDRLSKKNVLVVNYFTILMFLLRGDLSFMFINLNKTSGIKKLYLKSIERSVFVPSIFKRYSNLMTLSTSIAIKREKSSSISDDKLAELEKLSKLLNRKIKTFENKLGNNIDRCDILFMNTLRVIPDFIKDSIMYKILEEKYIDPFENVNEIFDELFTLITLKIEENKSTKKGDVRWI